VKYTATHLVQEVGCVVPAFSSFNYLYNGSTSDIVTSHHVIS